MLTHQTLSAECFNKCWELIDKPERSADDVDEMLSLAHASLWHWKQREDCRPLNLAIGYWQLSRVYALAEYAPLARRFGQTCLVIVEREPLSAFQHGYAYEALARAELVENNRSAAERYLAMGRERLANVGDEEERSLLSADLDELARLIASESA